MKTISFSPAAEADIDEIRDDTADRWGADQADHLDVIQTLHQWHDAQWHL